MEEPRLCGLQRDHELHAVDLGGGGGERERELRVAVIVVDEVGGALERAGLPGRRTGHAGRLLLRDLRRGAGRRHRLAAGRRLEADRSGEELAALARDLFPEPGRGVLVGAEHAGDPRRRFVHRERLEGRDHDVVEAELFLLPGKRLPVKPASERDGLGVTLERALHEIEVGGQFRSLEILAGRRHGERARPLGQRPRIALAAQGDLPSRDSRRRLRQIEPQQVVRGEDRIAEINLLRAGVGQRGRLGDGHPIELQLALAAIVGRDDDEVRHAEICPRHPGVAGHGHAAGRHLAAVDAVEQLARANLQVGRLPLGRRHVAGAVHDAEVDSGGEVRAE